MLTPEQLEEYLDILTDKRVIHFSCPEFTVSMVPVAPEATEDMATAIEEGNAAAKAPIAHGVFGKYFKQLGVAPPAFPGAQKPQE